MQNEKPAMGEVSIFSGTTQSMTELEEERTSVQVALYYLEPSVVSCIISDFRYPFIIKPVRSAKTNM